ncbi:MAG: AAA family ATPase [Oligoflexia bacterium]|nr:AAA family ATPase [Oligoflexia bacterium]
MKLALGYSDFKKIIDQKFNFVDKSLFIKEFIDDSATEVSVITRPRRFGKTLNLSMLRYFFAAEVAGESTRGLFDNLKIATSSGKDQNGVSYLSHQGQYPVIFLTFKDIKETSYENAINKLRVIIQNLYQEYRYLMKSNRLAIDEKDIIQKMIEAKAELVDLEVSLLRLSNYLFKHHQKKVYIFIDEYDTPIQSSYISNYYTEMIDLMRGVLGTALKDNLALNRAVVTGVIRVAKESLFSGLNNIKIYSVMESKYSQYFGFSEEEVALLLKKANLSERTLAVKEWYNGYKFAGTIVYNPWSIVNFVQKNELQPYWVNTSDNALIRDVVVHSPSDFKVSLEKLLLGKTCEQLIDEHVVFGDLKQNPGAAWSLLVSAGYLNVLSSIIDEDGRTICILEIPNKEIYGVYRGMIKNWLSSARGINWYNEFLNNLLNGNISGLTENLEILFTQIISVQDSGREPEAFYHGLMLGLIASLDRNLYEISSNRENGYGYYDIMIIPKDENKLDKFAIILELKSLNLKTKTIPKKEQLITKALEKCAKEALAQIEEKKYTSGMSKRGIKKIIKIGIAFLSKRFQIATAIYPAKKETTQTKETKKTKSIKTVKTVKTVKSVKSIRQPKKNVKRNTKIK